MTTPSQSGWFFASPAGNQGPYRPDQISELVQRGTIGPDTMVWREGLPGWIALRDSGAVGPAGPAPSPQPSPGQPPQTSADDALDAIFVGLVKDSWKRHRRKEISANVDEVLLGGVITAMVDTGYALIDLTSSGTDHYLRFEELRSGTRIIFKLTHLAESAITSAVLGHEARVHIGYGERVQNFGVVWNAIKQEMKGGYIQQPDPGIILVDGDISSQYIYVEVGLLWDINDYLAKDDPYQVNYPKLTQSISATIHALRKYLRGRIG